MKAENLQYRKKVSYSDLSRASEFTFAHILDHGVYVIHSKWFRFNPGAEIKPNRNQI